MRSTPKQTLIATIMFLCICCAQFAEAQRHPEGRIVLSDSTIDRNPWKCCPEKPCCLSILPTWKINSMNKCKSIGDLGILVNFPEDSTAIVDEVSLEIYSVKDELVFSTKTRGLSLRAKDNPTGYLLALDRTAASIAQRHFIGENKIVVKFKAKSDRGAPVKVYLVNLNEGKPVK
jgi:hypothetical protein